MKTVVLIFCLYLLVAGEQTEKKTVQGNVLNEAKEVGRLFQGQSEQNMNGKSFHYIKIGALEKKFLFFRLVSLSPEQNIKMGLVVYNITSAQVILSCLDTESDTCYIESNKLEKDSFVVVMVECDSKCRYTMYTYWANLEHIEPDKIIKFKFNEDDPTQLFHLNTANLTFQQIRLVLKPQTHRASFDNVKIYGNWGLNKPPTEQQHDFKSLFVWNDAEAIFLSKDEMADHKGVTILITGIAKTVYEFECELVKEKHHSLQQNQTISEYLQKDGETYYHFDLPEREDDDEVYAIRFSLYSGELYVGMFYDDKFQHEYGRKPYQYMSDMLLMIDPKTLTEGTRELFIKVMCPDSVAIYMVNLQIQKKQHAHQIYENVYDFFSVYNKSAVYFNEYIYSENDMDEDKFHQFAINYISTNFKTVPEFRVCNPDVEIIECINLENDEHLKYSSTLTPIDSSEVGTKNITKIRIGQEYLKKINSVEKRLTVLILFTNVDKQNPEFIGVEYSNEGRTRLLRDSRVVEEKLITRQKKHYKFQNNDPSVVSIKASLNVISGVVKLEGQRKDFTLIQQIEKLPKKDNLTIIVSGQVTDPIYLQVSAMTNAIYTITVQVFHEQHPDSASLVIAEDIEYLFKLSPYESINLQMNPIYAGVRFEYKSEGGPLVVCETNYKGECDPTQIFNANGSTHEVMELPPSQHRYHVMKLYNYISTNNVQVKVIYHSGNVAHCQQRHINQMYNENIDTYSCLKYTLPVAADLQITISRSDLGSSKYYVTLCSKLVEPKVTRYRTYIPQKDIIDSCSGSPNDLVLNLFFTDLQTMSKQMKIYYLISYTTDYIILEDGVSYNHVTASREGVIQTFFYKILNKKNTTITLRNIQGEQWFSTQISNYSSVLGNNNAPNNIYASNQENFHNHPTVVVTQSMIEDAHCEDCVIVVSLFSGEKAGDQIEYEVQITQNSIFLNQNQVRKDFLSSGSIHYFEYQTKRTGRDLIITVSDNNRDCAKIYLSDHQYPSKINNIAYEIGTELIFSLPPQSRKYYYIGVEGLEDCPYSISVSQTKANITRLRTNQPFDLNLQAGERKYFIVRHMSKESFKILTVSKYGLAQIVANQTSLHNELYKQILNNSLKVEDFSIQSQELNSLYIGKQSKDFCSNCEYLVMVEPESQMKGTIILVDGVSRVSLGNGKEIHDHLEEQGEKFVGVYHKVGKGKIMAKVYHGDVNISITHQKKLFQYECNKGQTCNDMEYSFEKEDNSQAPIQIEVTAVKAPAIYSLQLDSNILSEKTPHRITPGDHVELVLSKENQECIKGYVRGHGDQIIITTAEKNAYQLKKLNLTATLEDKPFDKFNRERVGNVLSVGFDVRQYYIEELKPYLVCLDLKSKQDVKFVVMQEYQINLLPENTETIVRGERKYVIHPEGDIVVDLFECKDKASIKYAGSITDLEKANEQILSSIGIGGQPHAIKIEQFPNSIFLDIKGEKSTVRWMNINQELDQGMGYFQYKIGSLTYSSSFNQIFFQVGGIKAKRKTSTHIESIKYTIYISNTSQALQQAIMCENKHQDTISYTTEYQQNNSLLDEIEIVVEKKNLTSRFAKSNNLLFNVVAQLELKVPKAESNSLEHYKFVYHHQTIPKEAFIQSSLQSNTWVLVGAVTLLVAVVILFFVVLIMCVIPWIGKLKNRVLVEENNENNPDSIPIPPSSDRNQIDDRVETDEKMT